MDTHRMGEMQIIPYTDSMHAAVLSVWERSVLATHQFLSKDDFHVIKELVGKMEFHAYEVHCLMHNCALIGFVGIAEKKIEMLFLDPHYFGQKWGFKLLQFAVLELGATAVDVNEQNTRALNFYLQFGFEIFERTEKDDQGNNHPLLKLRLPG